MRARLFSRDAAAKSPCKRGSRSEIYSFWGTVQYNGIETQAFVIVNMFKKDYHKKEIHHFQQIAEEIEKQPCKDYALRWV